MTKLDGKFSGIITKNKDNTIVPQDEWIVFLAKDNALLPTLQFYRDECHRIGSDVEHLRAVNRLISNVEKWRANNPGACKIPDVQDGEMLM